MYNLVLYIYCKVKQLTALQGAGYFCHCVLCSVVVLLLLFMPICLAGHLPQYPCGRECKSIPINHTTSK